MMMMHESIFYISYQVIVQNFRRACLITFRNYRVGRWKESEGRLTLRSETRNVATL